MSEPERLVRFELLGQEFAFYTATGEQEMETILALVRGQLEGNDSLKGSFPASKMAIMACLNMASQYVQLKKEYDSYKTDTEARFSRLNKEIRDSLEGG